MLEYVTNVDNEHADHTYEPYSCGEFLYKASRSEYSIAKGHQAYDYKYVLGVFAHPRTP
jgi:hypothetical protein